MWLPARQQSKERGALQSHKTLFFPRNFRRIVEFMRILRVCLR